MMSDSDPDSDERVRLDKWLWAARFYKTRNLASEAVSGGRVHVNGQRSKPSRIVMRRDVIEIAKTPYRYTLTVKVITDKRGSGVQAQAMYEEHADSIAARETQRERHKLLGLAANPHPEKRPDKRSRRKLKEWRGKA
jgi:ribosome-associated heat shock protein Hsp15